MKFIYSKEIVAARKAALIETFQAGKVHGIFPRLAAVVCSADPATTSHLPTSFAPIKNRITSLCERSDIHCVILVMSSKPEVDETALMNLIPASKDVDGLSAANLGALVQSAPD
jgi:methylenetetrahydrofolate dehydrogenase (NADP+)/methenyltetrahydrofolate cyclohydrolase